MKDQSPLIAPFTNYRISSRQIWDSVVTESQSSAISVRLCSLGYGECVAFIAGEFLSVNSRILGLAAFARRVKIDPWTDIEPEGGRLCALYTGGTVTYFSPEQLWLKEHLRISDEASYLDLKQKWQVTPATCDLHQAALVVLEMHSRMGPPKQTKDNPSIRVEAVRKCAARKPRKFVSDLSPADTERWIVEDLGFSKLNGMITSNSISGSMLFEIASLSLKEAKTKLPGLKQKQIIDIINGSKQAVQSLCTASDFMHPNVFALLEKSLSPRVTERPETASCALKELMDHELHRHLPKGAKSKVFEHNDEDVASTLGGLAKLMLLHGDVSSALNTSAKWVGMSTNAAMRTRARDAYCDLLKRHGVYVAEVELSRSTHSNWPPDMLQGGDFLAQLVNSIWWERRELNLVSFDFSEQPALEGEVLPTLLRATGIPTLRNLTLRGCGLATGGIPISIKYCTALVTLDLYDANHEGKSNYQAE